MSDNDIIKALECCKIAKLNQDCINLKCPFMTEYGCNFDREEIRDMALDLINRQKVEIETLQDSNRRLRDDMRMMLNNDNGSEQIRAKSIKEFAERLKAKFMSEPSYGKAVIFTIQLFSNTIDNLVKEMMESK